MNEQEIAEAERRAQAFREMAEEYCPHGGLLYGDPCFDRVLEAREARQN
jgi:hypothetical protein